MSVRTSCIRSKSIHKADGNTERSHVVLPVARGPKRKNDPFGNEYARVNTASTLAVKVLTSNAGCRAARGAKPAGRRHLGGRGTGLWRGPRDRRVRRVGGFGAERRRDGAAWRREPRHATRTHSLPRKTR